ncbi:MAG TPA: TlpA disulfide reductase family protein [Aggregatilinea sp.]|uniref:TlpA family protein disulfide reductase n=1 Tax=Aggregatilinea sp. TaxID=2806333 RepID=UPI002CEA9308|nr:TlpA disulfide reductase family protein [Aggregatilinea sp.]HML24158.1 TlpA disulfide reductase family protein [Aggregatilinea sp.]
MEMPDLSPLMPPPEPRRGLGWLMLLALPVGGVIAALLIITFSGGEDNGTSTSAAVYPSPAPVTFIPPTPLPSETAVPSLLDQPVPDFSLSMLDGETINLPEYVAGKIVFLNFWATWCEPCKQEMPELQQLQDERSADGIEVLAVTDPTSSQDEDDIRDFLDDYDLTLPVALTSELALFQTFNVLQIPITYIIDRDGIIRDYHIGPLTNSDIDAYLARVGISD